MPKKITTLFLLIGSIAALYACTDKKSARKATSDPSQLNGDKTYVNSADGKAYEADWKTYSSEQGVKKSTGPNSLKQVILLTTQAKIQQRIELDTLAGYIRKSENLVLDQLTGTKDTGEVLIQFTLLPQKRPDIILSYKGKLDEKMLNQLRLKVDESSSWFRTIKDSCVYQMYFLVNEQNEYGQKK